MRPDERSTSTPLRVPPSEVRALHTPPLRAADETRFAQVPAQIQAGLVTGNPWDGRDITWTIDGHDYTAAYNPGELLCMKTAREQGASRAELEAVHLVKALMPGGATVVNAEAS